MIAERLQLGDEIRIVAPSMSMSIVKEKQMEMAKKRLTDLGFRVTYGKNAFVQDDFFSSSIEERIEDICEAFADPNVKGILTAVGGYNANELLASLPYDLIKKNPKIFCGYGDITALELAIFKKTELVPYYGPHFSTFGMKHSYDYTLSSFLAAVTNDAPYELSPSSSWSEDPWYVEEAKEEINAPSYLVIQEGKAEGRLIGGNLETLQLLQGTEYMPSLEDSILFIEENNESHSQLFNRRLQALLQQPDAKGIKGILIGRFHTESCVTEGALRKIIQAKKELKHIPIIGNVNIGSVHPIATIPIGGGATIEAKGNKAEIWIEH